MDAPQPDYQFILDPSRPAKQPRLGNGSPKQRMLLVALGGLGFLFVGLVAWMVIGSISGEKFDDMVSVGKTQQKMLFASGLGIKESESQDTKSFTATLRSLTSSDYQTLEDYLQARGQKNKVKEIGNGKDATIEADFETSKQAGKFDEEFYKTIDELLVSYDAQLKAALKDSKTKTEKELLNTALTNLEQLQNARDL